MNTDRMDMKTGQKHMVSKYDGMSGCGIWKIEYDLLVAEPYPNISLVGIFFEGSNQHLYGLRIDVLFYSVRHHRSHVSLGYIYKD